MKKLILVTLAVCTMLFTGCAKKTNQRSIAVFIPGICDNSPVYAMLRDGVIRGLSEYNSALPKDQQIQCDILEAGTNQAEWGSKLTSLAATCRYDVIISSNPSLPELCLPILEKFPTQKFLLMDATLEGNPNIYTVCYNQYEQSFLTGYIGGLMTKTNKLALIAAQEYPVMNNVLYPYFEKGAKAANPNATVEFRVVGNWYDATKSAEIADSVIAAGADVLLPICGGASQGVITSAVNNNAYITWFDDNGFSKAPGNVISSTIMQQQKMTSEVLSKYLNNEIVWGKADMVGIKEGYVEFVENDARYVEAVPEAIREKMHAKIEEIRKEGLKIQ